MNSDVDTHVLTDEKPLFMLRLRVNSDVDTHTLTYVFIL